MTTSRRGRVKPTTEEGTIVGTVAYMSPEQAEGKKVDARSDIFSFGAVLYEMVTGRRAFQGDTRGLDAGGDLKKEPEPSPAEVAAGTSGRGSSDRRCLRKDPARRFQHMDDLKVALEELKEESDSGKLAGIAGAARKRPGGGCGPPLPSRPLLLAAVLVWRLREAAPPGDLTAGRADLLFRHRDPQPSFSPDGNKVAFVWNGEKEDNYDIYVKQIGSAGTPCG